MFLPRTRGPGAERIVRTATLTELLNISVTLPPTTTATASKNARGHHLEIHNPYQNLGRGFILYIAVSRRASRSRERCNGHKFHTRPVRASGASLTNGLSMKLTPPCLRVFSDNTSGTQRTQTLWTYMNNPSHGIFAMRQ
jgi:hypothetical protein